MCEPITAVLREVLIELQLDTCNAKIEAREAATQTKQEAAEEARFGAVLVETFRVIPANEAPPLALDLPSPISVFNLAQMGLTVDSFAKASSPPRKECYAKRMQPQDGRLRIDGAAYPARWTAADYKREVQRRARQVIPRPPKGARTKSEKLRALVGAG
ncbi:hypothetical protein [Comamonas antarctica]|uniref:Uncharacterized protein n=1 Tax=Comamonas antarctica TaxID=2743470 RepID=A0A6N1X1X2_9BURK|nr:hypothetical protein [Comamonas antarctica]QKV52032.1 hypothetical protein HUK68_03450 [Comamonas antarctica]